MGFTNATNRRLEDEESDSEVTDFGRPLRPSLFGLPEPDPPEPGPDEGVLIDVSSNPAENSPLLSPSQADLSGLKF